MGEYRRHRRSGRALLLWAAGALLLGAGFGVTRCLPQGAPSSARASDDATRTLVVFNENDPLSRDLADFYAAQRGIALDHVTGLNCPLAEEISRSQYDETIAAPLRQLFDDRRWWMRTSSRPEDEPSSIVSVNQIRFVALIRGMPLKIRSEANYPGDFSKQIAPLRDHNEASVDSEIAALGMFSHSISGPLVNPYFRSYRRIAEAAMPTLMLVGRLDAITGSTVRRMITDSIAAEKNGLWGRCYVDTRGMKPGGGDPMAEGDAWIRHIAQSNSAPLRLPTIHDDRPGLFAESYPMTGAALYFGWYTQNITGPFLRAGFHFQPGAVAFHLHSFSATTLRDPLAGWTGPLLEKGAAASLGNVYEPYLGLTTHFDVFADRLFDGFTLAESAYAGNPGVSWMNVVVGDPLYRPARGWQDAAIDGPGKRGDGGPFATEGRAYLQGAQLWRAKGPGAGAQALQRSGRQLRSGFIFEGLSFLQSSADDDRGARASLEQAARYYNDPADIARVTLTDARLFADAGQPDKALALLRGSRVPRSAPAAAALEEMAAEFQPPAPR